MKVFILFIYSVKNCIGIAYAEPGSGAEQGSLPEYEQGSRQESEQASSQESEQDSSEEPDSEAYRVFKILEYMDEGIEGIKSRPGTQVEKIDTLVEIFLNKVRSHLEQDSEANQECTKVFKQHMIDAGFDSNNINNSLADNPFQGVVSDSSSESEQGVDPEDKSN